VECKTLQKAGFVPYPQSLDGTLWEWRSRSPQKRKAMPARRGPRDRHFRRVVTRYDHRQSANASRRRWSGMRAPAP
jgi:hypothetical protein